MYKQDELLLLPQLAVGALFGGLFAPPDRLNLRTTQRTRPTDAGQDARRGAAQV